MTNGIGHTQARPKPRKFCPCVGVYHHHHHHQASQAGRGKSTLLAGNLNSRQARQEVSPIPGETSAWLAWWWWWWWWWETPTQGQDLGRLGHPSVVPSILGCSQDGSSRNLARPFDHPCKYSNFTLALDPISLPPTRHSWTLLLLPLGSFNNENMKFRNSFCSLPKAVSSSSSSSSSPPVLNKHPGGSGF